MPDYPHMQKSLDTITHISAVLGRVSGLREARDIRAPGPPMGTPRDSAVRSRSSQLARNACRS
jgi:hypothetical protein